MENGVVTVLYFFTLFYGKQEGNPSSHFMTFGTPSSVGCDHGYLPVSLYLDGKIPGAIAMDVRKGLDEH